MRRSSLAALAVGLVLAACSPGSPSPTPATPASVEPSASTETEDVGVPGGLIAYVAGAEPQIHLLDPLAGESRQLTQLVPADGEVGLASDVRPVISCGFGIASLEWAPDGQHIAFDYGACDGVIYVTDLAGEHVKVGEGHRPVWSPDGRSLVFGANSAWDPRGNASNVLLLADVAGGGGVVEFAGTGPGFGAYDPHWSPDGSVVAFTGPNPDHEAETAVYGVTADGAQTRVLARGVTASGWLDARRLLVSTNDSATYFAFDLDDGSSVEIGIAQRALAAPDGTRVALWVLDEGSGEAGTAIVPIGEDGDGPVFLAGAPMAWSPDGRVLLVGVAEPDGTMTLVPVDRAGHELAEYRAAPETYPEPADWQPPQP